MSTTAPSGGGASSTPGKKRFWGIVIVLGLLWFVGINPLGFRKIAQKNLPPELRAPGLESTLRWSPEPTPPLWQSTPQPPQNTATAPVPTPAALPPAPTSRTWAVRFQLDAKQLQQTVPITPDKPVKVRDYDDLVWNADPASRACQVAADKTDCAGPNGQTSRPMDYTPLQWADPNYFLAEYPVREAYFQELVGYIGDQKIVIGIYRKYTVPPGTGEVVLLMGENIQERLAPWATGGHSGTLTVTSK